MRAACSASPVICVRHKRRTDRGAHACGRCALRQAGCSLLPSGDARCALRSALSRAAYAFGCGGCARGGARSGGLERGPLCRPGEAQCADGRPTVAPREPTPRQREIVRCKRRDDARCLVLPSACAPRLPATLPPCRAVCGCAAGASGGMPCCSRRAPQGRPIGFSRSRRAARFAVVRRGLRGHAFYNFRRAPQGGLIGLSRSRRAAQFAVVRRGLRGARLLYSRRAP